MNAIIAILLPIVRDYGVRLAYAALYAVIRRSQGKPTDIPEDRVLDKMLTPVVDEHGPAVARAAMLKAIAAHRAEVAESDVGALPGPGPGIAGPDAGAGDTGSGNASPGGSAGAALPARSGNTLAIAPGREFARRARKKKRA